MNVETSHEISNPSTIFFTRVIWHANPTPYYCVSCFFFFRICSADEDGWFSTEEAQIYPTVVSFDFLSVNLK